MNIVDSSSTSSISSTRDSRVKNPQVPSIYNKEPFDQLGFNEEDENKEAEGRNAMVQADFAEDNPRTPKKRKKRRVLTICTANCKYDVVRRVAAQFGMREVTETSSWNLYWTDLSVSVERAKDMKRFQKINHFPGMTEICRKDLLARNLNRMLRLFPKEYNFFPKTWCFPADHGDAVTYAKLRRSKTFIIKPDTGCQGRGIYLTKNLKDVKLDERMICQVYIARPFLVDGYKFDLRIYTLITSCDPLRIYVYNDGLARFATSRYKTPSGHNASNVFMHLTNYALNKHSRMYVTDEEIGSKRKISTLNKWMRAKDIDTDDLWKRIDEVIVKTVVAGYPILKHSYHTCFPAHDKCYACFELLGFDILLDWKLKPYLLEVNHSPSFHTDAQIDKDIKEALLMDTFEILNLRQFDKRKIMEEDRKRVRDRLLQGINQKDLSTNDAVIGFTRSCDKSEEDYAQSQVKWEEEHIGNFRRIYPCADGHKYEPFFTQTSISVFQDTAASRAREEASRIQKEENEAKAREEESKRACRKWSDQKVHPESPNASRRLKSSWSIGPEKTSSTIRGKFVMIKKDTEVGSKSFNSFEPESILESEERERVMGLAQRDFLIKSYGVLEQIYMAMRKNGTLRAVDQQKYGLYGRLASSEESTTLSCKTKNSRSRKNVIGQLVLPYQPAVSSQYSTSANKDGAGPNGECPKDSDNFADLTITCNEAPVYVRPKIPEKFGFNDNRSNDQTNRITKAHVARTLTNTVRLHSLEKRKSGY